jgi:hypothetical protein
MRTIRMAALLMCIAACNLYFDDPKRGRPDAGDKVPPDAWIDYDAASCDNGGPCPDARVLDGGCNGVDCYPDAGGGDGGCHGGDGGGLPDAGVDDGGCNGVDCYPDARVLDAGCNGVDCYPDAGHH